jgi:hypothetical protein
MTIYIDKARLDREMKILATQRVTEVAGEELFISPRDAAKIFKRSPAWVGAMIKRGRLPTIKIGGREYIIRPVLIEVLVYGM